MRVMIPITVLFTVAVMSASYALNYKGRSVFDAIKTVPERATLEYRVGNQPIQVLNIPPGVYQISIKQLR